MSSTQPSEDGPKVGLKVGNPSTKERNALSSVYAHDMILSDRPTVSHGTARGDG